MKNVFLMLTSGVQILSKYDEATDEYVDPMKIAMVATHQGMMQAGEPFASYCLDTRYKIAESAIATKGELSEKSIAFYNQTLQMSKAKGINVENIQVLEMASPSLVIPSGKIR